MASDYLFNFVLVLVDSVSFAVALAILVWVNCMTVTFYNYYIGRNVFSLSKYELFFQVMFGATAYMFLLGLFLGIWEPAIHF